MSTIGYLLVGASLGLGGLIATTYIGMLAGELVTGSNEKVGNLLIRAAVRLHPAAKREIRSEEFRALMLDVRSKFPMLSTFKALGIVIDALGGAVFEREASLGPVPAVNTVPALTDEEISERFSGGLSRIRMSGTLVDGSDPVHVVVDGSTPVLTWPSKRGTSGIFASDGTLTINGVAISMKSGSSYEIPQA